MPRKKTKDPKPRGGKRDMRGITPGRGSAGRANARGEGVREPKRDSFRDVYLAARDFLNKHEDPWVARFRDHYEMGGAI